jgi:hypothetical protein
MSNARVVGRVAPQNCDGEIDPMPKIVDRSKWILLEHGRNRRGSIEPVGKVMCGAFRTRWKLPDGSTREWRERVKLGAHTMGVKAAGRLLIAKTSEYFDYFDSHVTAAGLPLKGTPDTTFAWLLEKVKEARHADWKANTAR